MEPIKPIEGTVNNGQEQALALSEVIRERYWNHRAEQIKSTVNAGDKSSGSKSATEEQPKRAHRVKDDEPTFNISNTYAEFSVDSETNEVVVRIIDGNSGELVRTLPPEKLVEEIAHGKFKPEQIRRRNIRL